MPDWDFWCSINKNSPRYANWVRVFDDPQHVPITSPIAERVRLPIGVHRVLFLKLDLLSEDERHRLVRHLSERFDVSPEEVEAELTDRDANKAVPILDEDVSILVLHPEKWID